MGSVYRPDVVSASACEDDDDSEHSSSHSGSGESNLNSGSESEAEDDEGTVKERALWQVLDSFATLSSPRDCTPLSLWPICTKPLTIPICSKIPATL